MINNCLNHDLPDLRIEVIFSFCFISFLCVIPAQAGISQSRQWSIRWAPRFLCLEQGTPAFAGVTLRFLRFFPSLSVIPFLSVIPAQAGIPCGKVRHKKSC